MAIQHVSVRVSINGGEATRLEESYAAAEIAEWRHAAAERARRAAEREFRGATPALPTIADRFRANNATDADEFGAVLEYC
jgi:hypothetical protein